MKAHTHQVSWELHNGPIPENLRVLHKCDVPACVRPDHLFLGTHGDNMADMVAKRRQSRGGRSNPGEQHGRAKLTDAKVIEIRGRRGETGRCIAREFGVSPSLVSETRARKVWSHI